MKVAKTPLVHKDYRVTIIAKDAEENEEVKEFTISVAEAFPLVTNVNAQVTPSLREGEANVQADAVVASLSTEGGTQPFIYTIGGTDAGSFKVDNNKIKVNTTPLTAKTYNITVTSTDKNSKSKTVPVKITVKAAYPAISDITISLEDDIREGETNAQAGAVVGTISAAGGTEPITYSIPAQYGTKIVVDGSNLKVGSAPLTEDTYSFSVKATDVNNKTFTKAAELIVLTAYPEITTFTISPKSGLEEGNANVQADAIVATMSVQGGSSPITYSLREDASNGADNASFKVDGANLKVNTTPLVTKAYKVALTATDTRGKTKNQNATITVSAPNITALNAQVTSGLQEGNPNVAANAKIADLSATGGIAPYTYALNTDEVNGVDNASFKVEGTQLKVNTTPLVKKDYKVSLKVTDKNSKTATKNITVSVGTPPISKVTVTPVASLTSPVAIDTKVADLATTGGIAPYTYSLKSGGDSASFKIEGTTIKAKVQLSEAKGYSITVISTDKNKSTKEQAATITVGAAG